MADELLLPEGTHVVHIGPFKTGTTALQAALHDARPALEAAGVVRLGTKRHESLAISHLIGRRRPGDTGRARPPMEANREAGGRPHERTRGAQ